MRQEGIHTVRPHWLPREIRFNKYVFQHETERFSHRPINPLIPHGPFTDHRYMLIPPAHHENHALRSPHPFRIFAGLQIADRFDTETCCGYRSRWDCNLRPRHRTRRNRWRRACKGTRSPSDRDPWSRDNDNQRALDRTRGAGGDSAKEDGTGDYCAYPGTWRRCCGAAPVQAVESRYRGFRGYGCGCGRDLQFKVCHRGSEQESGADGAGDENSSSCRERCAHRADDRVCSDRDFGRT